MMLDTHYPGMVTRAVEQLEHDLNWYKAQYEEAVKVIAQLHRGYALPGEPTYIHPADFGDLINKSMSVVDCVFNGTDLILRDTGVRFKQSALMPQISKTV